MIWIELLVHAKSPPSSLADALRTGCDDAPRSPVWQTDWARSSTLLRATGQAGTPTAAGRLQTAGLEKGDRRAFRGDHGLSWVFLGRCGACREGFQGELAGLSAHPILAGGRFLNRCHEATRDIRRYAPTSIQPVFPRFLAASPGRVQEPGPPAKGCRMRTCHGVLESSYRTVDGK